MKMFLETYDQTKAAKMERDQSLVENDSLLRVLVFSNPKKVLDSDDFLYENPLKFVQHAND